MLINRLKECENHNFRQICKYKYFLIFNELMLGKTYVCQIFKTFWWLPVIFLEKKMNDFHTWMFIVRLQDSVEEWISVFSILSVREKSWEFSIFKFSNNYIGLVLNLVNNRNKIIQERIPWLVNYVIKIIWKWVFLFLLGISFLLW